MRKTTNSNLRTAQSPFPGTRRKAITDDKLIQSFFPDALHACGNIFLHRKGTFTQCERQISTCAETLHPVQRRFSTCAETLHPVQNGFSNRAEALHPVQNGF